MVPPHESKDDNVWEFIERLSLPTRGWIAYDLELPIGPELYDFTRIENGTCTSFEQMVTEIERHLQG